jgi:hypothetical protein
LKKKQLRLREQETPSLMPDAARGKNSTYLPSFIADDGWGRARLNIQRKPL